MRIGDLDALKEDLKQYFSDGILDSVSAKLAFNMILRKIDNAPTVEPEPYFEKAEKDKRIYERGFEDGQNARPQGKWISNNKTQPFCNPGRSCSLCGKIVEFSENFCPKCGADMRGDNNENND